MTFVIDNSYYTSSYLFIIEFVAIVNSRSANYFIGDEIFSILFVKLELTVLIFFCFRLSSWDFVVRTTLQLLCF